MRFPYEARKSTLAVALKPDNPDSPDNPDRRDTRGAKLLYQDCQVGL
jgi:hypothetical protein